MKKIPSLLLVVVLLMQLCVFSVGAAEANESVKVLGIDAFKTSTTLTKNQAKGSILFTTGHWGGYKVNLPKAVSSIKVEYNTGTGSLGLLELHTESATGPLLGAIDTTQTASAWGDYSYVMSFEQPIQGALEIYVKSATGAHHLNALTFIPDDPTQTFAKIKASDNFKDIAQDTNRLEINILSDLGMIAKAEENFMPNRPATRAEFVGMIGNLIGAENFAGSISPFADVALDDVNGKSLSGLFSLGIIRGGTDGNFRPTDFITLPEVAAVCANALGYETISTNLAVVFDHINSLKIFKGVSIDDAHITKSEAAKIVYNLLLADYLMPTDIGSSAVVYNPSKNFLEKNSQFVHAKGRVTANAVTELYAAKKADGIKIDGVSYNVENIKNADYLGMICEYFYKEVDGERVLYSLRPAAKTTYMEVTSGHNVRFDKITERELDFTYLDTDEEYEFDLEASTSIIYNGTALSKSIVTLVDPETFVGKLTIIDNNRDDVIDCLWIDKVDQIIKVDSVVNGKIKDQITKKLYDTNLYNFKLFIGERYAMVEELAKNDVITLYKSSDSGKNQLVRARLSKATVTGMITGEDSKGRFTIEDKLYSVSDVCDDDLYVGLNAKFYLDEFNRIIESEKVEEFPTKVGAFLETYLDKEYFDETISIKLLTEEGTQIYQVAEKVVADGVVVKKAEDFFKGTGVYDGIETLGERTPVLYRLNENNQIVMLDTLNVGTDGIDDELTKVFEGSNIRNYGDILCQVVGGAYEPYYPIVKTAKNIVFTSDEIEENYKITTVPSGDKDMTLVAYSTKKDSMIVDLVVTENDTRFTDVADAPFIFKSIIEGLNEEGDAVKYIKGYTTAGEKQVEIDESKYQESEEFKKVIDGLSEGDLVLPMLTNNKVTSIVIIFTPGGLATNPNGETTKLNSEASLYSASGAGKIRYGIAEKIESNYVKLGILSSGEGTSEFRTYNCSSARVILCTEEANGRIIYTPGQSLSSLIEGDRILVLVPTGYSNATAIFVYRGDLSE